MDPKRAVLTNSANRADLSFGNAHWVYGVGVRAIDSDGNVHLLRCAISVSFLPRDSAVCMPSAALQLAHVTEEHSTK